VRQLLLLVPIFVVASCGQDPDGERIDGLWVGRPADCAAHSPPELACERLIACAVERKWPEGAPPLRSAVVFDKPDRLRDGTLINYGAAGRIVVFTLEDGSRMAQLVISTDGCPAA
jgi:hypothetical protein